MNLNIHNYEILNFTTDHIVISKKGISKIRSASLLGVIRKLHNKNNITKEELNVLFTDHGLDCDDAYSTLDKILTIKVESDNRYFDEVIVAHDWERTDDLNHMLRTELSGPLSICALQDLNKHISADKNKLIFLMCHQYDYQKLKNLYFDITRSYPGNAISVCYSKGDVYILGQPHIPEIGNPCHFCVIDRLLSNEKYKKSNNTWSNLLNFCQEKSKSVPSAEVSLLHRMFIIGALIKKIKLLTGNSQKKRYQDNVLTETTVSLTDGSSGESSISHWCMCDCLRNTP